MDAEDAAELEVEGPGGPRRLPLHQGVLQLGRDPHSDVVLPDASASWHHARLVRAKSGFVLEDLGSLNGTWVNGRRLSAPHPLAPGDRLRLGASAFLFRAPARPPVAPAAADTRPHPDEAGGHSPPAPRAGSVDAEPRVEIREDRRARDVGAITATPYFRALQRRTALRQRDPPPRSADATSEAEDR